MIEQRCACGRLLMLRDELAGKLIRCPQCAAVIEVVVRAAVASGAEKLQTVSRKGPPPLPAAPPPGAPAGTDTAVDAEAKTNTALDAEADHDDEELVEVVAVDDPALPPETSAPAVGKEEGYAAAPPLPVKRRPAAVPKQRRKKQSVFTEMYGDEPSEYGLYRDSRFLQNCVIGGIIGLLVVGLGIAIWSGAGAVLISLVVVLILGAIGIFFGMQDWWYW